MPEYFYHIGIELVDTHSSPINLSQAFQALSPFRSNLTRNTRDSRQDKMRPTATSKPLSFMLPSSSDDQRIDQVTVEAPDEGEYGITAGIGTKLASAQTKATFVAVETTELGERGIVHLYRDAEETNGLYQQNDRIPASHLWDGSAAARANGFQQKAHPPPKDDECTILSILAVPSYMTPKDFLAFVGKDTRSAVSHFRMIRTSRLNRYMVLMKFKDGRFARQWQHDWNGKVFNSMEPETCHVVFVKSVEVLNSDHLRSPREGPDLTPLASGQATLASVVKPLAPPTPALVELPTCPVCLERMDESTGLLTVLCQHVFHCSCLEKWSGGGCPVCRYSHDDFSVAKTRPNKKKKYDEVRGEFETDDADELECGVCHTTNSLWHCLICGFVGCGRYAGKHASEHSARTGHAFALSLNNLGVWDYAQDCYVHRIIANSSLSSTEKLVELPGRRRENQVTALQDADQDIEIVKRENLAFEYTQLLTSQLESQRVYFEEVVTRAADKAAESSKRAEEASQAAAAAQERLEHTLAEIQILRDKSDQVEKSASRHEAKSRKLEDEKKHLESEYKTTKELLDSISTGSRAREEAATAERNKLFKKQADQIEELKNELATRNFYVESLQEQCRDLRMQLNASQQLQNLVKSGQLSQADLDGATIEMGPSPASSASANPVFKSSMRKPQKATPSRGSTKIDVLASLPPKDPTDEEVTAAVETNRNLGTIASLLIKKFGKNYAWRSNVAEGDVIRLMMQMGFVSKNPKGDFGLTSNFDQDVAFQGLWEAQLIRELNDEEQLTSGNGIAEILREIGLGKEFELAMGKTGEDVHRVLLEAGVLQRKVEDGLYDSYSDGDGGADGGAQQKSEKAKKKKKKSKKKK